MQVSNVKKNNPLKNQIKKYLKYQRLLEETFFHIYRDIQQWHIMVSTVRVMKIKLLYIYKRIQNGLAFMMDMVVPNAHNFLKINFMNIFLS